MTHYSKDSTARKREWDMESPVQDHEATNAVTKAEATTMPTLASRSLFQNRSIGPAVLLVFLILLYIFSPYLPQGIREYLSALRH